LGRERDDRNSDRYASHYSPSAQQKRLLSSKSLRELIDPEVESDTDKTRIGLLLQKLS
jgi:hypothetical protein